MSKRRSKGDGSIYYDESHHRYVGQVSLGLSPDGKRKRKTVYGKTKTEVNNKIKEIQSELLIGKYADKSTITIYALAKKRLDSQLERNDIQPSTYYRHIETLKELEPFCQKEIQSVTEYDIQTFLNTCLDYAQSTIKKIYSMLSATFADARRQKIITDNPMEFMKCPKSRQETLLVRALTREEQRRLVNVLTTESVQYSEQMLLSLFLGLRMGEVNALSSDDINLRHNKLYVHRTITRGEKGQPVLNNRTKTYSGTRTIPILGDAKDILENVVAKTPDGLVFTHKNKMISTQQVKSQFERTINKYDIIDKTIIGTKVSLHSLRHTFGTRCVEAGMPPEVLKEIMGHKDIKVTMNTYYYATDDHIRQNFEKAFEILSSDGLSISQSIKANKNP